MISELNPVSFVQRSADIDGDKLAVVSGERRFTYREFAERVRSLAWYFVQNGYKRIAIVAPNTVAHLETLFAANLCGGIVMALNYRLTKAEIKYMLDLGEADLVVVDHEMVELVDSRPTLVDKDFSQPLLHCQYTAAIESGAIRTGWPSYEFKETDTLGLFFTSGTTGRPKAAEYTFRGTYLAAMANIIDSDLNQCRYLWTLPMFHAAGWTYPYAVTAARGTHYCLRKVDPEHIWTLLIDEQITHFNAAPTVNTMLVNSPSATRLSHKVRVIVAGSAPSATLFESMNNLNLFPVHMYGLTETYGPFAVSYFKQDWLKLPKSEMYANMARQGFAFITSDKLLVVDEKDNPVEQNGKQIGEIAVGGNIVAKGYYRNPEETAKSFGKWFKSGDLAVVHPDGSVQVMDRKKDIIISGGENISSVAVESVLVQHPSILEVAVVGIPDPMYGEVPVACVVVKSKVTVDELVKFAKDHLGGFQVPRKMQIVSELPKTATGKVRKNVLRDQFVSSKL